MSDFLALAFMIMFMSPIGWAFWAGVAIYFYRKNKRKKNDLQINR